MKVALYCRVSTQEQAKFGFSIDAQKEALIKYAKDNKYDYDLYCDDGVSAKNLNRPELSKMFNRITDYNLILFTKLDRLSRNIKDAIEINELLTKYGIKMIAIQDQYIDTSTANGEFIFNLRYALAQQERKQDSERIKNVFDYKVKNAKEVISGVKIYGYDIIDKHYIINEKEAKNIKKLYKIFIDTNSLSKACEWWRNNIKIGCYATTKKRLKDIKYNGKYKYGGKIYDDYIPQIIDDETFNKAQAIFKKNIKSIKNMSGEKRYYIYSSLVVCGCCNHKETGTTHNYKYYKCKLNKINECTNTTYYRESELEKIVLSQIEEKAQNALIKLDIKAIEDEHKVDNTKNIERKIRNLQDLYIDGLIDKNSYKAKYTALQDALALEKSKVKVVKVDRKAYEDLASGHFIDYYNKLDDEHKLLFNREVIKKITINSDKTVVVELVD